ncbi:MAG TPA: SDR family oxidoreductase [Bacteroidetes bacterium]|nr:SDR family oxidoreductase [Bacteroidota bacterium]
MDLMLKNRLVLVLGASQGLGLACAQVLSEEGARVVISSRSRQKLEKAAGSLKTEAGIIPADLSRREDIKRLYETMVMEYGIPDGIILNAGGPPTGHPLELDDDKWYGALETNLMSGVRLARLFVPRMIEKKFGRIVAIASTGVKQSLSNLVLSNAARMGLLGYLKTLSNEVARHQVLVNILLPGPTETERLKNLLETTARMQGKSLEEVVAERTARIPAGRFGKPSDLADLAAFLISPRNQFITGQSIAVDGGYIQSNL